MAFRNVHQLWIVGMAIFGIALIVYIVSYATGQWFTINGIYQFGLFKFCVNGQCYDLADFRSNQDLWPTAMALASTGLGVLVIGGILSVVAQAFDKLDMAAIAGFSLIIIGGILGGAGGIYHLAQGGMLINGGGSILVTWSSIIFVISSFAEIVAGIVLSVAFCCTSKPSNRV